MNRNEAWDALSVQTLSLHLAWATLELLVDDVDTVQLLVSGNEMDVQDLRVALADGTLTVEQPAYGLTHRIDVVRWMQVCLRLPRSWRGAVDASTVAGPLSARGLSGTDFSLETVSGDLRVAGLSSLTLGLKTVTGNLRGESLQAQQATLRTVSGRFSADECVFQSIKLNTVSGDTALTLNQPFQALDANLVSADLRVSAPITQAHVVYRSVGGKLRTNAVSLTEDGPEVSVSSVSGNLYLSTLAQAE